jgi:endonuclease/exonuclease/phosphatase family metal-dependent hydrolase
MMMSYLMRTNLALLLAVNLIGGSALAAENKSNENSQKNQPIDDTNAARVMTFNIRYNNPQDGKNAWPHRKEKVASVIRLHRTDLAGLQEVQDDQLAELQKSLPEWKWAGLRSRGGKNEKGDEHVPILYRANRFDLLDEGVFWLSKTPEVPASKGWDSAMTRICTWVKLRDRRTQREFFLFNTHFDHVGKTARTESAKLMKARAESVAKDAPAILIGDLNCLDTSEAYSVLSGKPFVDSADESSKSDEKPATPTESSSSGYALKDALHATLRPHHGPTSTFQAFGPLKPDARIDYVFVTPTVKVLQHAILNDQWDLGRWPSDHLPVLAEVLID